MIQLSAPSGETRQFTQRATLTVHYCLSLAVECTSVVHLFLRCIVGLNECTRERPLWFRTPLKMAVPSNSALFEGIGGDFGYSQGLTCFVSIESAVLNESFDMNDSVSHLLKQGLAATYWRFIVIFIYP